MCSRPASVQVNVSDHNLVAVSKKAKLMKVRAKNVRPTFSYIFIKFLSNGHFHRLRFLVKLVISSLSGNFLLVQRVLNRWFPKITVSSTTTPRIISSLKGSQKTLFRVGQYVAFNKFVFQILCEREVRPLSVERGLGL